MAGGGGSFVLPLAQSNVSGLVAALAAKQSLLEELLNEHIAPATETIYTYTPPIPLSLSTYEYFKIIVTLASQGGGQFRLRVNTAQTQTYYYSGKTLSTVPTQTLVGGVAQANYRAFNMGAFVGEDHGVIEIYPQKTNNHPMFYSKGWNGQNQILAEFTGQNNVVNSFTNLTNLEFNTDGVGWGINSVIRIFGVRKL